MAIRLGDMALVRGMLAGRQAAFEEFFASAFPALFRFALTRLDQDADLAEEIVQLTLTRAVAKLATYRGEAALFTWLCTFCRHEISAWYRRAQRAPQQLRLAEEAPEIRAALDSLAAFEGAAAEDEVRRGEIKRLVEVTLDSLPRRYGHALEWKYLEGLSVKEIAARLEIGPKAAESLLTRARQAFRDGFVALTGEAFT
jgi:RNA polymerase sigma-70 factor (ECF subfamily)